MIDPDIHEETSVHYYIPMPESNREILYYPTRAGYFDCTSAFSTQQDCFDSYFLLVMLNGSLQYYSGFHKGLVQAGQALLLDCNIPHKCHAEENCSFVFVFFNGSQSTEIYHEIISRSGPAINLGHSVILHETIGELLDIMRREHHLHEARGSALIHTMLMQLLEISGGSSVSSVGNTPVDLAIRFIQSHLTENLSVNYIAAQIGYSSSRFTTLFQQELGISPYHFILQTRIKHSKQLLQCSNMTVQEIAFRSGFNSVANFCTVFRRETGKTPNEFRRKTLIERACGAKNT